MHWILMATWVPIQILNKGLSHVCGLKAKLTVTLCERRQKHVYQSHAFLNVNVNSECFEAENESKYKLLSHGSLKMHYTVMLIAL